AEQHRSAGHWPAASGPRRFCSVGWRIARRKRIVRTVVDAPRVETRYPGLRVRRERTDVCCSRGPTIQEIAQDVLQDATMAVVVDLLGRVDPDQDGELDHFAIGTSGPHHDVSPGGKALLDGAGQADDIEGLGAIESKRIDRRAARELQGQYAHA